MDALFNCTFCGSEAVFDVDENTTKVKCTQCKYFMQIIGFCKDLDFMVKK